MLNIFTRSATTAGVSLIWIFFASDAAFSQPPDLSLTAVSNRVSINYSLADTNGMFFIIEHPNPALLFTDGNVLFAGHASDGLTGSFVQEATSTADFFAVLADAQTTNYIESPPIDDEEPSSDIPSYYFESPQPIPPLVTGNEMELSISVLDPDRKPLDVNGTLTFLLMTTTNDGVPFPYTITPGSTPVTHGLTTASIVVTSSGDLSKAFLGATFSLDQVSGSVRPRTATAGVPGPISIAAQLSSYADTTEGWIYPLPDACPISGGFGEWPGHTNIHWGIDLAAPVSKSVLAAKGGMVSRVGKLLTTPNPQVVVIDHGIGFATCYMHIVPFVEQGEIVHAGDIIGEVADSSYTGYPAVHLHFEVMQSPSDIGTNYSFTDARYPFPVINPVSPSLAFNIPFLNDNPPQLKSFQLQNSRVVIQAVDTEPHGIITPLSILFQADGNPDQIVDFLSSSNVIRGYKTGIPGYAPLSPPEIQGERDKRYKFIFNWDTSLYASSPAGPRAVSIILTDLGGASSSYNYVYGPPCEVEFADREHTELTYYTATITGYSRDENAPAPPPDKYILTLTGGGKFLDSGSGTLTTPNYMQDAEAHVYQFTAPYTQTTPVQLKVQSQLFPNMMHVIGVPELPR